MAGRYVPWLVMVAVSGATVGLGVATSRLATNTPNRVRPMATHGPGTPNVGSALLAEAAAALKQDRYADAERLARAALTIREQTFGLEHVALARPLRLLAASFFYRDRFAEAEPPARRALAILERHPGPPHSGRISLLILEAHLLSINGSHADADAMSRRALALAEEFPGYRGAGLVETLGVRGTILYEDETRRTEATPFFERALALLEQQAEPGPATLVALLNNLGVIHFDVGEFAEAKRCLMRSLAVQEREPEKTKRGRIRSLVYLSYLDAAQGRYDEAEPLMREALAMIEAILGPDHPSLVENLLDLARILRMRNQDITEVEPLTRRAMNLAAQVFAADSEEMAATLANAAEILSRVGHTDEAVSLLSRALEIAEKIAGPDNPGLSVLLERLSELHKNRGTLADAEIPLKRAIDLREKNPRPDDREHLAKDLACLSWLYANQKRHAEAEPLARRALSLAEQVIGPESPQVGFCLNHLAVVVLELGHVDESESLAKRWLAIVEKGPADDIKGRMDCLALLSYIYKRQGRADEAEAIDRRSHALNVEEMAKIGFVEMGEGAFVPSPTATQAQKDAWAARIAAGGFGGEATSGRQSSTSPTPVTAIKFEMPTSFTNFEADRISAFFTDGRIDDSRIVDKADPPPPFPSDLGVQKTSGTAPIRVFPAPLPE